MQKLRVLKPNLSTLSTTLRKAETLSDKRMAGRKLQDRRLRMWTRTPCCAICGRLTDWPYGFELDHIVRLDQGGKDTEDNCQVLCVYTDDTGNKAGCHAEKTSTENRRTP
jgi:5-methylcytosine-specific restriction protein A